MAATAESTDKSQMAKANDATDSARIGWAFLSQYYSYLNKDPARLHCFYTKRSTLIHAMEGEDTTACYGQAEIHDKIMKLGFDDCKVYISNVDSQSSAEHGIIVQVVGEMSNSNGPWRKFAQTFFLAEQPNGYFVLNDICRYIKEEGDEDTVSTPAPAPVASTPTPAAQPLEESAVASTKDSAPASVESVLFNDVKPVAESAEEEKKEEEEQVAPSEPAPVEPVTEPPTAAVQQPNGIANGDVEKTKEVSVPVEPLSAVEHKSNEPSSAPAVEEQPAPPAPAVEEVKKAEKEEAIVPDIPAPIPASETPVESAPSPTPQASTSSPSPSTPAPTSAPSASTPSSAPAPAPAPTPAAPAAPKSWASLAASGGPPKWGSFQKPAAAVASQKPAESSTPSSSAAASSASAAQQSSSSSPSTPQFTEQVQAVAHSNCFVKGVVEFVTEKQLREVLTTRFGPLKELDIIRSKACAFVEFTNLNDARKAIQVSMRHQDGGEGAITFETPSGDKARINVVERKPHNERPPPKPRNVDSASGAAGGGGGGASTGGGGGGKGQQKDGQQQRNQGGRGPGGGAARNQGGRGGARTGGGGRQNSAQGQSKQ